MTEYWWCGTYSPQAEALLTQHGVQSGLNQTQLAFAQWCVYCNVHLEHPLSFTLFCNLIDKLIKPLQASGYEEDIKLFWDATKKLLPSCFTIIRKIRKKTTGDKNMMKQLVEVLRLLGKLMSLEPDENIEMFPQVLYPWLEEHGKNWDVTYVLTEAIKQGANHWFTHILENNAEEKSDNENEEKLRNMIRFIQLVRTDLQKAIEYYDKIFQE